MLLDPASTETKTDTLARIKDVEATMKSTESGVRPAAHLLLKLATEDTTKVAKARKKRSRTWRAARAQSGKGRTAQEQHNNTVAHLEQKHRRETRTDGDAHAVL